MTQNEITKPEVMLEISEQEKNRLTELETKVKRGMTGFLEVGRALLEIRDAKLYRENHATFEAYLADRWDLSTSRAYELIGAHQVVKNLSAICGQTPKNESQVRILTGLEPDVQRQVWLEAERTAPNGKITGKLIADIARRILERIQGKSPTKTAPRTDYQQVLDQVKRTLKNLDAEARARVLVKIQAAIQEVLNEALNG